MIKLSTRAKKIGVVVAVLIVALAATTYRYLSQPPPPPMAVPPSVQLLESRLIGRKDGHRQWEVLSRSVLQADNLVTLEDMDEIIMFQDENPYLSILAPKATWERRADILTLEGPVVVEGEDEFRLESNLLIWDGSAETLTSPAEVLILWEGMEIKAGEMVMESAINLLHLKNGVQIRDGTLVWNLNEAIYNLDGEIMDFYGDLSLEGEVGRVE